MVCNCFYYSTQETLFQIRETDRGLDAPSDKSDLSDKSDMAWFGPRIGGIGVFLQVFH